MMHLDECYTDSVNAIDNIKVFGGGEWEKQGKFEEAFNSFPAISAHVTAYARMMLLSYIEQAGWNNVFYTDTDSLFVNYAGYQNLLPEIDSKVLGKLKVEDISKTDTEIRGCKDYTFNHQIKTKGVAKTSISLHDLVQSGKLHIKDIPETYRDKLNDCFVSLRWSGMSTFIKHGKLDNYSNDMFIKVLSRSYDKGCISKSGWVIPFTFPEKLEAKGVTNA